MLYLSINTSYLGMIINMHQIRIHYRFIEQYQFTQMKDQLLRMKKYSQISDKYLCDVLSRRCNQFISSYKTTKSSTLFSSTVQSVKQFSIGTNLQMTNNTDINTLSQLSKLGESRSNSFNNSKQHKSIVTNKKIKLCTNLKYFGHNNFELYSMERNISENILHKNKILQHVETLQRMESSNSFPDDYQRECKISKQQQLTQLLISLAFDNINAKIRFLPTSQDIKQSFSQTSRLQPQKVDINQRINENKVDQQIHQDKQLLLELITMIQQEYTLINRQLDRVEAYTKKKQMKDVFNFGILFIDKQNFSKRILQNCPALKIFIDKFDIDVLTNKQIQQFKQSQHCISQFFIDFDAIINKRKKQKNRKKNMRKRLKKNNKLCISDQVQQAEQSTENKTQASNDNNQRQEVLENEGDYKNQCKQLQLNKNKSWNKPEMRGTGVNQQQKKKTRIKKQTFTAPSNTKQESKQTKQNILQLQRHKQYIKQTLQYLNSLEITNDRINCNISDDWIKKLRLKFIM